MKITVTGATGHLGRQVLAALADRGVQRVAAVHTPAKAADLRQAGIAVATCDFADVASMTAAFAGSDVVVFIPSKTYALLQRVTEFENTLAALRQAGVSSVVFVSFFADQETNPFVMSPYYAYAPRRLAGSGLRFAVVKNALYADPLGPYLPELIARKHLIYPVGQAAMTFITLADSAAAIAAVALHAPLRDAGQRYTVTQAENWTMPALGELMTTVTGQPIGYAPVSTAEFARIYADEGDGAELASMYAGAARGLLATVTGDFAKLVGRQPESLTTFLPRAYAREQENI